MNIQVLMKSLPMESNHIKYVEPYLWEKEKSHLSSACNVTNFTYLSGDIDYLSNVFTIVAAWCVTVLVLYGIIHVIVVFVLLLHSIVLHIIILYYSRLFLDIIEFCYHHVILYYYSACHYAC